MSRLKIAHIITGLNVGGAEMMLHRLVAAMDSARFENEVISLTDIGPVGKQIEALGIPVSSVGISPTVPNPFRILRLSSLLRNKRPDVVQTWMLHGDLVGGIAAYLAGHAPVFWGIHHTTFDPAHTKWTSKLTLRGCKALAGKIPTRIVCCSDASLKTCEELGYERSKMVVIPNGFDLDRFYRDSAGATRIRAELGLGKETPIVGLVARFHPQKDHNNFFEAAEMLLEKSPNVHFVLCGDGVTEDQPVFRERLQRSRSAKSFHLLGRRNDLRQIMSSFSVATLTSAWGEAFPLVLGEAMCCEVPCVATDVGDSRRIVDGTGRVVSPSDPAALRRAWLELLSLSETEIKKLGSTAREYIGREFGLNAIVTRYEALYEEAASAAGAKYRIPSKRANDLPSCVDV
jgi:glycosyltransferase involved in cell wall biosynthesis